MAPLCRGQKIEQKIFNDLFRSNIRDKYKIDAPVNEEEEESEEEDDDGFSGQRKKEEVEEDPVERKPNVFFIVVIYEYGFCGQTEEAEKDPVEHLSQLFVNQVFTQRPKPWRRSS